MLRELGTDRDIKVKKVGDVVIQTFEIWVQAERLGHDVDFLGVLGQGVFIADHAVALPSPHGGHKIRLGFQSAIQKFRPIVGFETFFWGRVANVQAE